MGTTIDDLISLKDEAVNACETLINEMEKGMTLPLSLVKQVLEVLELSASYDAAGEDSEVSSLEEWREKHSPFIS